MKITFLGAAGVVTGSSYLLEAGGLRMLVDCGLFQGDKDLTRKNYEEFPFDARKIDLLLLTHAHIDHCGLLPKLAAKGFKGRVYTTSATIDLAMAILEDSANIQEQDTKKENERRMRIGLEPRSPLYTKDDVKTLKPLFSSVEWNTELKISKSVKARFRRAGHILGASSIEVFADGKKIVFSGDLGQFGAPIIKDPEIIDDADYVLIESTYGNMLHEKADREEILLKHILETYEKGGKLMIPCFAIERTQEILYTMSNLIKAKKCPKQPVFLDSPLAIKATGVFKKHKECYNEKAMKVADIFNFSQLKPTQDVKESMKINSYDDPCIIMAGDGMCTGGRIRHHFKHGIWNKKNTVLFVGYQAEGTLGRHILEGENPIRMMGMEFVVKADIRKITSFSAHADSEGLMRWARSFPKKAKFFIIHGENDSQAALKANLEKEGYSCKIPMIGDSVTL
ncbi:MAG: MBL fold metallo-hydrolase [Nanoarchaeota archaeon]|nr:MBL fold metallo-hydrolase [Nanoarchaeota archaeon]